MLFFTHTKEHGNDDMNILFHINTKITPASGKSFRSSHYVRAADAVEAGKMAAASLSNMGFVKIGKVVEVDTDGMWIPA